VGTGVADAPGRRRTRLNCVAVSPPLVPNDYFF
jgi:hypothetical protein